MAMLLLYLEKPLFRECLLLYILIPSAVQCDKMDTMDTMTNMSFVGVSREGDKLEQI